MTYICLNILFVFNGRRYTSASKYPVSVSSPPSVDHTYPGFRDNVYDIT